MNVIIKLGKSEAPYFYQLSHIDDINGTIFKNEYVYHQIIHTVHGWKVIGLFQHHKIEFREIATLDKCDQLYSEYKSPCDKYWDLWIAPSQKPDYYIDINNKLLTCLDNRLLHHYSCEDSIDVAHSNAIKKIEHKIMVVRLWYATNFDQRMYSPNYRINELLKRSTKSLVEEILTHDKDIIYVKWHQVFGTLRIMPDKIQIVNLLLDLRVQ